MSVADVALSPIHRGSGFAFGYEQSTTHYSVKSVLVFLSVSGSTMPMLILESDSIAEVKLKIQTCNGSREKEAKKEAKYLEFSGVLDSLITKVHQVTTVLCNKIKAFDGKNLEAEH